MSNNFPSVREEYTVGNDALFYVEYFNNALGGTDKVLQYKLGGYTEAGHITIHPNGTINVHSQMGRDYLGELIRNNLSGVSPSPSQRLLDFVNRVRHRV